MKQGETIHGTTIKLALSVEEWRNKSSKRKDERYGHIACTACTVVGQRFSHEKN